MTAHALAIEPGGRRPIRISRFASVTDSAVAEHEVSTFDEFFAKLRPQRFPLRSLARDESDPRKWKKPRKLGLYAFADFDGGRRRAENVTTVHVLTVEYDGGCSLDDASRVWGDFDGCAFTTFNSTDEDPRARVHLALSRSVTPDEYALLWLWAADRSGEAGYAVDPQPKDACRVWYDPAAPEGAAFAARRIEGVEVSVDDILARASARPSATKERRTPPAEPVPPGSRNVTLTSIAGRLRRIGLDAVEIERTLATCNERRCQPPLPDSEIATIAGSIGWRDGDRIEALPEPRGARELIRDLGREGPSHRLTTALDSLDEALGGGASLGTMLVIVGAPSTGKTALALHLATRAHEAGLECVYLAADEPPNAIAARLAHRSGLLTFDDPTAVVDAAARVPDVTILDGCRCPVEIASDLLRAPGVLIVDSAQAARCDDSGRARDQRSRVESVVAACGAARARGHLVVLLSEASRAFYRARRPDEQIDALSAGRETSSLEYAADTLIALRRVKDAETIVAEVAKARVRGGKRGASFGLDIEPETTLVSSVTVVRRPKQSDIDAEIMREVAAEHPGANTTALRAAFRDRLGGKCSEDRFIRARNGAGLMNSGSGNRAAWHLPGEP